MTAGVHCGARRLETFIKTAVATKLAARPVYPRWLPTCRVAQLGGLGPLH